MAKLFKIRWFMDFILIACLVMSAVGLLLNPKEVSGSARAGIMLCVDVIIPSLFPFFVISTLTIELGLTRYLGALLEPIMRPLFRLSGPCSAAVVLGFLGGYPVGAKSAISLYEGGLCSKDEAERLLAFCNNSGPAFILGAVGAGILGSSSAGWLLYLTHTAASLTVGLVFRFYKRNTPLTPVKKPRRAEVLRLSRAFTNSVKSSFQSVFYISAFVIFFTVTIHMLFISGVLPGIASGIAELLGIRSRTVEQWLTGFIEITSGLWSLQGGATTHLAGQMAMAAFMLGWAGLSVHCQVLSFIGESGLSARTYIIGKLLHGLLSAGYTALLVRLTGYEMPVSTVLAEQVKGLANMDFRTTLGITMMVVLCVMLVFIVGTALAFTADGRVRRSSSK